VLITGINMGENSGGDSDERRSFGEIRRSLLRDDSGDKVLQKLQKADKKEVEDEAWKHHIPHGDIGENMKRPHIARVFSRLLGLDRKYLGETVEKMEAEGGKTLDTNKRKVKDDVRATSETAEVKAVQARLLELTETKQVAGISRKRDEQEIPVVNQRESAAD